MTITQEALMATVWGVFFVECDGHAGESLLHDAHGAQLFADELYGEAVEFFNEVRRERLRAHVVEVNGEPDVMAHNHLVARDLGDADDSVELRPIEIRMN